MGSPLPSVVGFAGSRALRGPGARALGALARSLARAGVPALVGCAAGADSVALGALVAAGAPPGSAVLAAFGPGGVGACPASAVGAVAAAARAGLPVRWWAGGGASVPARARLVRRSLALVGALAAVPGAALVVAPRALPPRPLAPGGAWASCGSGSWSVAAAAARAGVLVVVLPPAGVAPASLPALSGTGSWSAAPPWAGPGALAWLAPAQGALL